MKTRIEVVQPDLIGIFIFLRQRNLGVVVLPFMTKSDRKLSTHLISIWKSALMKYSLISLYKVSRQRQGVRQYRHTWKACICSARRTRVVSLSQRNTTSREVERRLP